MATIRVFQHPIINKLFKVIYRGKSTRRVRCGRISCEKRSVNVATITALGGLLCEGQPTPVQTALIKRTG